MTLQTKNGIKGNPEAGVTLLLSILLLAAVTVSVFTIAAITVGEIRTSGDITRSEPAITGAEAVTEELLFYAVRGVGSVPDCSSPMVKILSNGTRTSSCVSFYLQVPYTFSVAKSSEYDFYAYNPTDQTLPPGYTNITVTITGGSSATAYLCSMSAADCVASGPYTLPTQTISMGGTQTASFNLPDPTEKYQFIVKTDNVADATFSITSAPKGLPAGTTTIEATGSNLGTTRKLRTTVPQ